jgi:hypothetical protein
MRTLAFTSTLLTLLLLSDAGFCKQPAPLLEIRFNEDATSGEIVAGPGAAPGSFANAAGRLANFFSEDAAGVSGKPGDRAFDNSASANGGSGGVARFNTPPQAPSKAVSLTFTAWIKHEIDIEASGNIPRLFKWGTSNADGLDIQFFAPHATVFFSADTATKVGSRLAPNPQELIGKWTFVAVVYSGSGSSGKKVRVFSGSPDAGIFEIPSAAVAFPDKLILPAGEVIGVGNVPFGGRAFSGWIDNVRLFVSESDDSAALEEAAIKSIFEADQTNSAMNQ